MKRNYGSGLIALGLLAGAAGSAQAQNVTIYGLLDTGVEHVTNVANGGGLTRMPSLTGTLPSRFGLRGSEDLGGGLKAVFHLEAGYSLDSGASGQGGRLFGRQSNVGLAGSWGSVTIGRQYTMYFNALLDSDILGPNIYGSATVDNYIPNAREDNSVAYRGTFGALTVGATWSFGRDAVNAGPSPAGTNCAGENAADSKQCRGWSAMAKYDTARWGVALGVDRMHGGPAAFAGLVRSDITDTRSTVNGWVKFGALKVGGGVMHRDNEGSARSVGNIYYLGAAYPVTPQVTVDGAVFRHDIHDTEDGSTLVSVRGMYHFSKRTAAYLTAGHIDNRGLSNVSVSSGQAGANPLAGESQNGVMIGMRHFF